MTTIKLRRGTAAQWSAANPTLASGEPGYELDTGKEKRGDGVTPWATLPYFSSGASDFTGSADDITDGTAKVVMTVQERDKLTGIQPGATANDTNASLRDRSTHQGEQAMTTVTGLTTALAAKADLVNGLLPTSQLPKLAITDVFPVTSEAAMLALTAERGDIAKRTDVNRSYILVAEPASTLANWEDLSLSMGTGEVDSVNGQVGTVVLGKSDIGLDQVDNTADVNKPVSTAQASAIAAASTSAVTYARLPAGVDITVNYYKSGGIHGAANAWPTARPHNRTDSSVIWVGPSDPGDTLAIAQDSFKYVVSG